MISSGRAALQLVPPTLQGAQPLPHKPVFSVEYILDAMTEVFEPASERLSRRVFARIVSRNLAMLFFRGHR